MKKRLPLIVGFVVLIAMAIPAIAQDDTVQYFPRYYDPILEEMDEARDSLKAIQDSVTSAIRKRQEEYKEAQKKIRRQMRFDVSGVNAPDSVGAFTQVFHFPPVRQYNTGTCWSFSATSFVESEVYRQTGRKVKLSEMHTVYYEYLAKASRYVRERGKGWNGEGSEANAALRILREHGVVPLSEYTGLTEGRERHDHEALSSEITAYLDMVTDKDYWDEDEVLSVIRVILNKYLGAPPENFTFEGKIYTPQEFLSKVLKFDPGDYVDVMSTLSFPYYTQGPFEVPDNWWYDSTYYNLPLGEWYNTLDAAIRNGYSAELGGDNSEPGWYGQHDLMVIPTFDIPQDLINADSREFRFYNQTTTDDHGIHLVGYANEGGRTWYLIKDSGSSARHGKFDGYHFMRDDYVRLKILTYTVHRDALGDLIKKFTKKN